MGCHKQVLEVLIMGNLQFFIANFFATQIIGDSKELVVL